VKQYYYKTNDCKALHATDAECICWHDEGTGPFPGHRIGVHTCHWRDKPEANKMVSDTPRTDAAYFEPDATMYDLAGEMKRIERELNAANERIEALNRGNAAAERILCELTGCESGRDVPDWIVAVKQRIKRLDAGDAALTYSIVLDLQKENLRLQDRIKRLEEAGDAMLNAWLMPEDSMEYCDWIALSADVKAKWYKAKEAKP
jgi:hypothetical protein